MLAEVGPDWRLATLIFVSWVTRTLQHRFVVKNYPARVAPRHRERPQFAFQFFVVLLLWKNLIKFSAAVELSGHEDTPSSSGGVGYWMRWSLGVCRVAKILGDPEPRRRRGRRQRKGSVK